MKVFVLLSLLCVLASARLQVVDNDKDDDAVMFITGEEAVEAAKVVIAVNKKLTTGQWVSSASGQYQVGISSQGVFTLKSSNGKVLWSTNPNRSGSRLYMQNDGNLVFKSSTGSAIWSSSSGGNRNSQLYIEEDKIYLKDPSGKIVWEPTISTTNPNDGDSSIVLAPNARLEKGEFVSSPNGKYSVGLSNAGALVLQEGSKNIWSSPKSGGYRVYQQGDGNIVLRSQSKSLWKSMTDGNPNSQLRVTNDGQIQIIDSTGTIIWLAGVPKGTYKANSHPNLTYPVRGIFYYPWYPTTWTVGGSYAHYKPTLGWYSSGDINVVKNHIESLEYANCQLAIASWWGPDTKLDRARLTLLLDESRTTKWTVYYEDEFDDRPSVETIKQDLAYLKKWFTWHPNWAHVEGKPLIYVWNRSGEDVPQRWMQAAAGEWYVSLKLSKGFDEAPVQPSMWHQYSAAGALEYPGVSFTIAAGFWLANKAEPMYPRVSTAKFCDYVQKMVASKEKWQLIVSFNEAGEGTMLESSPSWKSNTKFGGYLDCLHKYP